MSPAANDANPFVTMQKPDRRSALSALLENPNLPSPPAIVLQIVEKASKPDCDPVEVLTLLSQDSGLCGQVLKTVNSGLFGLSKPVTSLKQAVMVIGIRPLRSLVLSLALPAIRTTDRDELVLRYWQESVAGAVIVRQLAEMLHRPDPDDDFMAGLLRDLGILVFRAAFPDEYRNLWKQSSQVWATRQCQEEQNEFGLDHAEVSAVLLESWNLPPEIHTAIRFHHDPSGYSDGSAAIKQRALMLCFASKVATLHSVSPNIIADLLQFSQQHFGMNQASLVRFLKSVTPAVQEFAAILKVDIGQCPNYSTIIAAGCQELVRLSVAANSTPVPAPPNRDQSRGNTDDLTLRTLPSVRPGQPTAPEESSLPKFNFEFMEKLPPDGAWLNGYEVKEILGRGGMGVVFKAYDPSLNRFAAIKMMTQQSLVSSEAREFFKREARAAAAIQHENIVTIYAVSETNGIPYLVLEYLSGSSLQDRIDKQGALPLDEVIRIGRQIASGLEAAHSRGVIHRDIKPANILFSRDNGTVKITDFGLARVQNDVYQSQAGSCPGTPAYMAPEQFGGGELDCRADLFSLGSLLYSAATGRLPFKSRTILALMNEICNSPAAPIRSLRPELPAWLAGVISKLHAKAPALRYQSAAEVVQAIDQNTRK